MPDNDWWYKPEFAEHPVTNVSWDDASAYATWVECELPTEAQWEKAARGPEGYIYPWGNEWDPSKCRHDGNRGSETTAPVKAYPEGRSGYGTYQQSGNVWEWRRDWYAGEYYESDAAKRNPEGPPVGSNRIIRGSSWQNTGPVSLRCAFRYWNKPTDRSTSIGFRIARKNNKE